MIGFPYFEGLEEFGPSFISEAVERSNILTKELEEYWKCVGQLNISSYKWSLEIDITRWALRFVCDMISIVITRESSYSMAFYYNILSTEKPILHHHIPFIKDQVKETVKNRNYMFKILDLIIMKRRKEIKEIPVGTELRNDMLTSLIVTNTVRDINCTNITRDNIFRPMTEDEIRANLLDSFQGGIDNVDGEYIQFYSLLHLQLHPIVIELQRYVKNPCEIAGHRFETGTVKKQINNLKISLNLIKQIEQDNKKNQTKPISNFSKKFYDAKKNYETAKKEAEDEYNEELNKIFRITCALDNYEKAIEFFELIQNEGNDFTKSKVLYKIRKRLFGGFGCEQNITKGRELIKKASSLGLTSASVWIKQYESKHDFGASEVFSRNLI
ncbi:cytochrome P450 [Gigaspora margarita]|uniref:Cytochrome P450 n=1 Tax=Gigaspora margarita TaxID=4874 RepID=A0A8H4AD23_GIGMA|nr:cytochrome P450 [Gigaspora margarita]